METPERPGTERPESSRAGEGQSRLEKSKQRAREVAQQLQEKAGRLASRARALVGDGVEVTRLKTREQRLRLALERAYRDLGRELYRIHQRSPETSPVATVAELKPELQRVEAAERACQQVRQRLAELRERRRSEQR